MNIPGEQYLTTSVQFLELDSLPRRIAFVGGGYISFEFANMSVRCGAEVSIFHGAERPLEHFDPDLVGQLLRKTRQLGVDVQLCTQVEAIERASGHLLVCASTEGIGAHVLGPEADELINLFALAIQTQATAEMPQQTISAYPTHGSDVTYML